MKISDLLLERATRESYRDYVKRLVKKHGIVKIGSGWNASVFQYPDDPNVAVKVYDSELDTGYNSYLKWCLKNQNNKYAPRILYSEKITVTRGNEYSIVFFEKLLPLKLAEYKVFVKNLCSIIGESPTGERLMDFDRDEWLEVAHSTNDKDLSAFAKYMANMAKESDGNDLHQQNIMKRTNGQLVIIDPFSG